MSERRRRICIAALPALLVLLGADRGSRLTRENPFFSRGVSPVVTGPAPKGAIGLESESCGTCHAREYAAWSGSLHARAGTDALYLASLRDEPEQDCLNCHTPMRATRGFAGKPAEGVSCAACHVRRGVVLTATAAGARKVAPHALRHEPRLGTEDACLGCHQFNFPTPEVSAFHFTDEPMQDTHGEHARARSAASACQSCHMPQGGHAWPGGHDEAFLRRSVTVESSRVGEEIAIALRSKAGHATPTGDLFRFLVLELDADATRLTVDGAPLDTPVSLALARTFEQRSETVRGVTVTRKRLVKDLRIPVSGEVTVKVRLPPAATRLSYRLRYRFVSDEIAEHLQVKDHALSYVVAEGSVNLLAAAASEQKQDH